MKDSKLEETKAKIIIETERFVLRHLQRSDASSEYASWFNNEITQKYIHSKPDNIEELRGYIDSKIKNPECVFLGIFEKSSNKHIGNIKYEPINGSFAVMGILIGDPSWRGLGVAKEVIESSAKEIKRLFGIRSVVLGVKKSNLQAISSYKKIGFVEITSKAGIPVDEDGKLMRWDL